MREAGIDLPLYPHMTDRFSYGDIRLVIDHMNQKLAAEQEKAAELNHLSTDAMALVEKYRDLSYKLISGVGDFLNRQENKDVGQ